MNSSFVYELQGDVYCVFCQLCIPAIQLQESFSQGLHTIMLSYVFRQGGLEKVEPKRMRALLAHIG